MNIEEREFEERVRKAYLRNYGDIWEVQKELGIEGSQMSRVMRIIQKIKKELHHKATEMMVEMIMPMIYEGAMCRIGVLRATLKGLEGRAQQYLSICCNLPVEKEKVGDEERTYCIGCRHECTTNLVDNEWVYDEKKKILDEIRREEVHLIDTAIRLGYIDVTQVPLVSNTIVIDKKTTSNVVLRDQKLKEEVEALSSCDKLRLLRGLENRIVNLCKENP